VEKQGVIALGVTPPEHGKPVADNEKEARDADLEDDTTKRLADVVVDTTPK